MRRARSEDIYALKARERSAAALAPVLEGTRALLSLGDCSFRLAGLAVDSGGAPGLWGYDQ